MAQTIKLRRSAQQGAVPTTEQLQLGELAINTRDGKVFIKKSDGTNEQVVEVGSGAQPDLLNIQSGLESPDYIQFDTSAIVTAAEGKIWYNPEDDTLNIGMSGGVIQQVGQEFYMPPCKNNSGVTINNGDFVMATGAQGDKITIAKAVTNGTVAPEYMIGIATQQITADSEYGLICTNGVIRDINTSAWPIGTILYPNPAVAGGLTSTKPTAPAIKTPIAIVLRQHETTGRILVRMSNGSVLGGTDSNVEFTTLQDGDTIIYNSVTGRWENKQQENPIQLNSGSIVFGGTSGEYSQDNANLFWDDTNNRLGIGTSSPGAKLNVVDNSASDAVRITQTGAGNALVVEDSANPDATPFVIDASGRVGVGKTPTSSLGILGSGNPSVDLDYYENGSGGASYRGRKSRGSVDAPSAVQSNDYLSTLLASGYGDTGFGGNIGLIGFRANQTFTDTARGTNIVFENTPDGSTSRAERMRITSAGNVGIGTSSPNAALEVNGNIHVSGVNRSILNRSNSTLRFGTNNTEQIFMQGNGDIRFFQNTTTDPGFANTTVGAGLGANGRLALSRSGGTALFANRNTNDGGVVSFQREGVVIGNISVTTTATSYNTSGTSGITGVDANTVAIRTNSTERMRITSSGNVGIGTTNPESTLEVNGEITVPSELSYDVKTSKLPDTIPSLNINFVQSGVVDSRIIFARSSTATFVGSNGSIQVAAVDSPRLDYDPATLVPKGLLIEEQRTNLLTYSEQFDNAAWGKINSSISINAIVSPDGTTNADKLIENTTSGTHDVRRTVTASASTAYTQTIFVKAGERTKGQIQMFGNSGGSTVVFDLSAGTSTATGSYGGWSSASTTITNCGNGWYKITNTATTNAGLTALVYACLLTDAAGSGVYTGDDTSGFYIWGAQVEAGAFATSYIPTVASQVTRTADTAIMTTSGWYNQAGGTILCSFAMEGLVTTSGTGDIWRIDNSEVQGESIRLRQSTVIGGADAYSLANNVVQFDTNSISLTPGVIAKTAVAFTTNSARLVKDGSLIIPEDTSVTLPTINRLILTGSNKWIRNFVYYPSRLADSVLEGVTTL